MNQSLTADRPLPLAEHECPVKLIRFSPSGRYMATGDTELQIKIWENGKEVIHIDPRSGDDKIRPTENIRGIEFAADESLVYVAASDTVNAYSLEPGVGLVWRYRPPRHFGFLIVSPQSLAALPENRLAVSFDYGSMAALGPDGYPIFRVGENYAPRRLGYSALTQNLVGADAFNLCVWSAKTGQRLHRWVLDHKAYGMAVSPTDSLVVVRGLHTLSIYDFEQFERVCEVPAGEGLPSLAFSPVEPILASGEKNRVRLIDSECRGVQDFYTEDRNILTVAFSPDGTKVVAGCSDGQVVSWYRDMSESAR
jgi:WD40 repeat protein